MVAAVALPLAACGVDEDRTASRQRSPQAAGAPVPGGGLSIQEAMDSALDGPLTVKGFVVQTGDRARLCSALAESFPPQCGGPSLEIEGSVDAAFAQEGNVRWTETEVSLLGHVDQGVLRVSETSR